MLAMQAHKGRELVGDLPHRGRLGVYSKSKNRMLPLLSLAGTGITMAARHKPRKPSPTQGQLRIIGGQWRGRKLHFTEAEGLRPTGDRIRETLFNWLAPSIQGAHCLDLFAGSGALGLEALSRGAASCELVELNRNSAQHIANHLQTLNANNGSVHVSSAEAHLQESHSHYDIIFLDPPFKQNLITQILPLLAKCLKNGSLIYLETAKDEAIPALPKEWQPLKQKQGGQVSYQLFEVIAES